MLRIILIGVALGVGAYFLIYGGKPGEFDHYPQRKLAPAPPVQERLPQPKSISYKGYILDLTHRFTLNAVVLSQRYYDDDREADLAKVDLAVGWGPMSHPDILNSIKVAQSNRYYYFRYTSDLPVSHSVILRNSSNIHIIPANGSVYKKILSAQRGRMISLSGYLVNVKNNSMDWSWNTSLSRADTGGGACEIILVDYAEVVNPV